ncbi:MAG: DUF3794 domain-containing protein [Clostridiaceae bacterium]|jgi:hypothetical protein|nr:DUF3794 domain-containing protein [Clostridiaceae bacterium]
MELNKNKLEYWDGILSRISNYEESTDAIVPDTYPDISRIVCARGMLSVKDAAPQKDRMLISGTVKTAVLYLPEGETDPKRLDIPLTFAHIEECRGIHEDTCCFARCALAGVEAVAVNSRKVSVTARLVFDLSAYQQTCISLTESIERGDPSIETQCETRDITLIDQLSVNDFTVLEDAQLPDADDLDLLHACCEFRPTECRAMNGKAIVRGDAVVTGMGLQPDGELRTFEQTTNFMQVFPCEGLEEGAPVSVRLAANSMDCRMEPGSILSFSISASAMLCAEKSHTLSTVTDLYSTTHELRVDTRSVTLQEHKTVGRLSAECTRDIALGEGASHLVQSSAVMTGSPTQGTDGRLSVPVTCQGLYHNEDGAVHSFSKPLTLEFTADASRCEQCRVQVASAVCGKEGVTLRARLEGDSIAGDRLELRDITEITIGEPLPAAREGVTLTLRYIDEEEALWDVARTCRTTVAAIRGANGLGENETAVSGRMLLIPMGD